MRLVTDSKSIDMAKYGIKEPKEKEASYHTTINLELMDELEAKINDIIIIQKKYRDKEYSAEKLANDLGTNTRYISAVVSVRFHMNYASLINTYRIRDAMTLLADKRYQHRTIEDIADMVGFSNRQSFYVSFYKINHITPRSYKLQHMDMSQEEAKKKEKTETGGRKKKKKRDK